MKQQLEEIVNGATYGTLCTVDSDGKPRGAIIRFALDYGRLYWRSHVDAQHSQDVAKNPNVFITLYDTTQRVKGGVYISSQAVKLEGLQKEEGMQIYSSVFSDFDKLGADADVYCCEVGGLDTEKTKDRMLYFLPRGQK